MVVASLLDRIESVEAINPALTWDQSQWRVSPGNLAKAIVLLPFIYPRSYLPIYSISDHYKEMDMNLLFTAGGKASAGSLPPWKVLPSIACFMGCPQLLAIALLSAT